MKQNLNAEKLIPFINEKYGTEFKYNEGDMVNRMETYFTTPNTINKAERTVDVVFSTSDVDRSGDVVIPLGADTVNYAKNPVILLNHDASRPPIAKALKLMRTDKAVEAKIQFADTPLAQEIFTLVSGGFMKSLSIGFRATQVALKGTQNFYTAVKNFGLTNIDKINRIILGWELVETSIVTIPCNTNALVKAIDNKEITISEELSKFMKLCKEEETPLPEVKVEPVVNETVTEVVKTEEVKPEPIKEPEVKAEEKPLDKPEEVKEPEENVEEVDPVEAEYDRVRNEVEAKKKALEHLKNLKELQKLNDELEAMKAAEKSELARAKAKKATLSKVLSEMTKSNEEIDAKIVEVTTPPEKPIERVIKLVNFDPEQIEKEMTEKALRKKMGKLV
jgi:phage head maturation protease